ncbi:MAG: T9SS type A sorting domain-containing protein [Bacteroidales bacterium]
MDITPADAWGGVNSTDALLILNHFAHIDTLEGMELAASDVNYSQTVNGTDALFVMKRYTDMISSFPSGDWLYNTENFLINGNQVINDLAMLCFGDVNSSNTLAKKDDGSLLMVYEGTQLIQSYTDFDLTVSIKDVIEAGAVSLGFVYPEEYIEMNGVELLNTSGNVIYTAGGGMLKIAWADLNALSLNAGDEMLVIHCTANDLSTMQNAIQIGLSADCEIANPMAQAYNNVTLSAPELVTLAVGIVNPNGSDLWLSENYPNPFNSSTTIRYQIPENGQVSLKIYNITGGIVSELVNAKQRAGEYSVEFSSEGMEAGIYFYKLEFRNSEINRSLVNKMSVTR